ncbi:isoprenylcysteine carboxyl methyltransferase (icmt) family [Chlorella sorokiniana]|uniref:Protein-S-isoprenylcysteine O-methyltransferase n=1 Tax=Chlorella sorokiniana TaxID=3076 RepID=A0A2P6TG11_CHLSO|nr:isoprenylcysteine carboxyl methyltransferase (icmt) family [Chlorella sorokiniana]|eukprot:PRW33053.1 isoprenylcysteine carboxyl methyltransferase (icmt) family [Chlorella sorokiniana]
MPPRTRGRPAGKAAKSGSPGFRISKAAVGIVLAAFVALNCRSPNHLDAGADQRRDAYVGDWHLTSGLKAGLLQTAAGVAWYLLAAGSPVRRPWSIGEAAAAAATTAGYLIRSWCFATLGRLFTYEVGIRSGHELVSTGPYALLLHPSYLGTGLLCAGFIWFLGGPRSILRRPAFSALLAVTGLVVLGLRVSNEEAVLQAHFGERWAAHAATRWRFIPFVI